MNGAENKEEPKNYFNGLEVLTKTGKMLTATVDIILDHTSTTKTTEICEQLFLKLYLAGIIDRETAEGQKTDRGPKTI